MTTQSVKDDIFHKATVAAAVFFSVFFLGYFLEARPPYDAFGYLIGRDFVNMWMGARAALFGHLHTIFDFPSYSKSLHAIFPTLPEHNWSYPPDVLLFVWPLGYLQYFPALILWSAIGVITWIISAYPRQSGTAAQFAFLLLGPAVAMNLFAGQNGFFFSSLMVAGLSNIERRPVFAGFCLGLLTMKPQLGLLVPIALVLQGQWRCIASAAATTVSLFMISALIFGFAAWSDYLNLALPLQTQILKSGSELMPMMMPSVFMNARIIGLSANPSFLIQAPFTFFAIAAVVWTYSTPKDIQLSRAVLVTACFIATPYVFNYDMIVFSWVIWSVRERLESIWDERIAMALWTMPVLVMVMGLLHIPGSACILAAFLWQLISKLKNDVPMPQSPPKIA